MSRTHTKQQSILLSTESVADVKDREIDGDSLSDERLRSLHKRLDPGAELEKLETLLVRLRNDTDRKRSTDKHLQQGQRVRPSVPPFTAYCMLGEEGVSEHSSLTELSIPDSFDLNSLAGESSLLSYSVTARARSYVHSL